MVLQTRRGVLGSALAVGAGVVATAAAGRCEERHSNAARFSLKFAPHDGSFASRGDQLEQIAYAADQGFTAWEDYVAPSRPAAELDAIAKALAQRGMAMATFVVAMPKWRESRPVLSGGDEAARDIYLAEVRRCVDVARRLGAKWLTAIPGFVDRKVPAEIQMARIVDLMRRAGDIVAPHGLTLVLEGVNARTDYPDIFIQTMPQAYDIAKSVNNPAVKVLADLYHVQVETGNLIPTLDICWDEIRYVQFGDNPRRMEPGTGEINFANIVRWLRTRAYDGVVGMEHGNSLPGRQGEERMVSAYRAIDRA